MSTVKDSFIRLILTVAHITLHSPILCIAAKPLESLYNSTLESRSITNPKCYGRIFEYC